MRQGDPVSDTRLTCVVRLPAADLENQLYPGRRQPRGAGIRNCPSDGSDAYAAPLQRNIRIRLAAPIFRNTEAENPRAEVHGDVKVARKDLKPQCHLHHRMVAYRSGAGTAGVGPPQR